MAKQQWWNAEPGLRIPSKWNPAREAWDKNYRAKVDDYFLAPGEEFEEKVIPIHQVEGSHAVIPGHPRTAAYVRMYRADDPPPPLVGHMVGDRFHVIDGNRRLGAAAEAGATHVKVLVKKPRQEKPRARSKAPHAYSVSGQGKLRAKPLKRSLEVGGYPLTKAEAETKDAPELPQHIERAMLAVQAPGVLIDRDRRPQYRGHPNPLAGHCFVATETLYHLINGRETGWQMCVIPKAHLGGVDTHWFLRHKKTGTILDPTASQFEGEDIPYHLGNACGTSKTGPDPFAPTKRAADAIERARAWLNKSKVKKAEYETVDLAKAKDWPQPVPAEGEAGQVRPRPIPRLSALPVEQSAAFKAWHGKQGVTHPKTGQPLRVFHGNRGGISGDNFEDIAWFSAQPKMANNYADVGRQIGSHDGTVTPAYIRGKFFDYRKHGYQEATAFLSHGGHMGDEGRLAADYYGVMEDHLGANPDNYPYGGEEFVNHIQSGSWVALENPDFVYWLKDRGYAGILTHEGGYTNYGVFRPDLNVKSPFSLFQETPHLNKATIREPSIVYRVQDPLGRGPYNSRTNYDPPTPGPSNYSEKLFSPHAGLKDPFGHGVLDRQPTPHGDLGYTEKERAIWRHMESMPREMRPIFGFATPEDAIKWFGDVGLHRMERNGWSLRAVPVKAGSIKSMHSGQVIFEPKDRTTLKDAPYYDWRPHAEGLFAKPENFEHQEFGNFPRHAGEPPAGLYSPVVTKAEHDLPEALAAEGYRAHVHHDPKADYAVATIHRGGKVVGHVVHDKGEVKAVWAARPRAGLEDAAKRLVDGHVKGQHEQDEWNGVSRVGTASLIEKAEGRMKYFPGHPATDPSALQGTKVTDERGQPLQVFRGEHGKPGKSKVGHFQSRGGSLSFGNQQAAKLYSEDPNNWNDDVHTPRIVPAYLSIKKPALANYDDPFIDMGHIASLVGEKEAHRIARKFGEHIENTGAWQEEQDGQEAYGDQFSDPAEAMRKLPREKWNTLYFDAYHLFDDPKEVAKLRALGYDGAIHIGSGETAGDLEYKVFHGGQVHFTKAEAGLIRAAAFQHRGTGQVIETGMVHDMDALPGDWRKAHEAGQVEEGFVGHDGSFLTRKQAGALVGLQGPHDTELESTGYFGGEADPSVDGLSIRNAGPFGVNHRPYGVSALDWETLRYGRAGKPVAKAEVEATLAKMALVHNDPKKPMKVWRVENEDGIGPYHAGAGCGIPGHDHKQKNPNKVFSQRELAMLGDDDSNLYFAFSRPEHAAEWFGGENGLALLADEGFQLREVPAVKVWSAKGGKQVIFEPHPSDKPGRRFAKAEVEPGKMPHADVQGSNVTTPHRTYSEASAAKPMGLHPKNKNIWVRPPEHGHSNSDRTLMVQFTSGLLQNRTTRDSSDDYYDKLYANREGYHRPADFWEVPQWQAHIAHNLPGADHYTVRDLDEAADFIRQAGYKHVAFSALDVNKEHIKRLATAAPDQHFVAGGYGDLSGLEHHSNITVHPSVKSFVESEGRAYQPGYDYRHFGGVKTIPRLTLSDGCRHQCTFCAVPKRVEEKPREEVLQQADAFARDLDSDLIYLNDKTFGQAPNHRMLPELYQRIKSQNPNFKGFVVQTTAAQMQRMTPEFLRDAGIRHVELGVETYNDAILRAHKKPATEALIEEAANKLRTAGVSLIPNIMVGLPGENRETYGRTMAWLNKHKDIISHVNAYNLALYDESELGKRIQSIDAADHDENSTVKSWHVDPQVHKDFHRDLMQYGMDRLDPIDQELGLGKDEVKPLGKMALIHDDPEKPRDVYRVQNSEGQGPYFETFAVPKLIPSSDPELRFGNKAEALKFRAAHNPNPAPAQDFPSQDLDESAYMSGKPNYAFSTPEQALGWFGDRGLAVLANNGFHLTRVPAAKVWEGSKQAMFHHSTTGDMRRFDWREYLSSMGRPRGLGMTGKYPLLWRLAGLEPGGQAPLKPGTPMPAPWDLDPMSDDELLSQLGVDPVQKGEFQDPHEAVVHSPYYHHEPGVYLAYESPLGHHMVTPEGNEQWFSDPTKRDRYMHWHRGIRGGTAPIKGLEAPITKAEPPAGIKPPVQGPVLVSKNPTNGAEKWDYSHLLRIPARSMGYKLHVTTNPQTRHISASVTHRGEGVGETSGNWGDEGRPAIGIWHSYVDAGLPGLGEPSHQGKGLGSGMYRALMAHAGNVGAQYLMGSSHSTQASFVHRKVGGPMGYKPTPNVGRGTQYPTEARWKATEPHEFDNKYAPYIYPTTKDVPAIPDWWSGKPPKGDIQKGELDWQVPGAVVVHVQNAAGQVLWGRRRRDGKWCMPGGHIEPGELPADAAIRELHEETGLSAAVLVNLGTANGVEMPVYRYLALQPQGQPTNANDPDNEFDTFQWVDCFQGVPADMELAHGQDDVMVMLHGWHRPEQTTTASANVQMTGLLTTKGDNAHRTVQELVPSMFKAEKVSCPKCGCKDVGVVIIGEPVYECADCEHHWEVPFPKDLENSDIGTDVDGVTVTKDMVKAEPFLAYHGTDRKRSFNQFRTPAYFTDKRGWAAGFGNRVISANLSLKNPYVINGEVEGRHFDWDKADVARMKREGYDGVVINHPEGNVYAIFDPHQANIINQGVKKAEGDPKGLKRPKFPTKTPSETSVESSPLFQKWFGQSKVTTPEGKPQKVFHGTLHNIETFNAERSNINNFYGRQVGYFTSDPKDAYRNYARPNAPDRKARVEMMRDLIGNAGDPGVIDREKAALKPTAGGNVMPVYLRLQNPVHVSPVKGKGTHFSTEWDENDREHGNGIALRHAIFTVANSYGLDPDKVWGEVAGGGEMHTDGLTAGEVEERLRSSDEVMYADDPKSGYSLSGEFVANVWKQMGFDGIMMHDVDKTFPGMNLKPGTNHFIAFNPRHIKSATGNRGTFNLRSPNVAKAALEGAEQVGEQMGSNDGGVFRHQGQDHYYKFSPSLDHAKNEVLAAKLYEAAGHKAVPIGHLEDAVGTASPMIPIQPLDMHRRQSHRRLAQKSFGVHAWLANWDATINDNMALHEGKPITMDTGGALLYRALGEPKGERFGDDVTEFHTLRNPDINYSASRVFGDMTPQQIQASVADVARVPDETITRLVMEHGPGNLQAKKALAKRLIARKASLLAQARSEGLGE